MLACMNPESYIDFLSLKVLLFSYPSVYTNICFGCSKEPNQTLKLSNSFDYPQRKFWLRNKKKNEHKIVIIFLPISFNICYGCSIEPFH